MCRQITSNLRTLGARLLLQELRFLLSDVLGAEAVLTRPTFGHLDRLDLANILSAADDLAERRFSPIAARIDAEEPLFFEGRVLVRDEVAQAFRAYADAGLLGAGLTLENGGLQLPSCLSTALMALFGAACTPAAGYGFLTTAAARVIQAYGDTWQKSTFLNPMRDGIWTGTMCLSEPHAGSALGEIRTQAVLRDDGSYDVTGTKMWISGGDQDFTANIIHLVLARIDGGVSNASGLSLLIVPKMGLDGESNRVATIGLNHKLGHRATSNCALEFGANGPSIGYLIGKPHLGLSYMFHMMNEARIGVGVTAAATAYAGFRNATDHAQTRVQGRDGKTGLPVAIIRHADVQRMLLLQRAICEGGLCLCLYGARMVDDAQSHPDPGEASRAGVRLGLLTPLVKHWCSERGLEASSLAIQVMGGAGYVRDHPVERLFRDQRLNTIHEGTSGILAIDFVLRGVRRDGGAALLQFLQEVICELGSIEGQNEAALSEALATCVSSIQECTAKLVAGSEDDARAWASPFSIFVGDTIVAWLWLRQIKALRGKIDGAAPAKRAASLCFIQLILKQSLAVSKNVLDGMPAPYGELDPHFMVG
jgi:butyryl-CoA dehydrogenase